MTHISKALRMARAIKGSHSFTCHPHVYPRVKRAILPLLRKHSPDGATDDRVSGHLIAAYYSFMDPERMKGWIGLVGGLVADGLPTFKCSHVSYMSSVNLFLR